MHRPCEVPEGFGGEDAWWSSGGFRCRYLVNPCEVPEGSGADALWNSKGFRCLYGIRKHLFFMA